MARKNTTKKKEKEVKGLTKFGLFMYKITVRSGLFVAHRKWLFYLLSYTWGLLETIAGWVILGFVSIFMKKKIEEKGKFFTAHYIIFGNNWGGLECGSNFLVSGNMPKNYTLHTKCHEFGHTCQAAVWGPFVLIFFYIPSVIRYWHQHFRDKKKLPNVPYDACYYELSASMIGEEFLSEKEGKDYHYYNEEFKRNPDYGKVIHND